jgi:dienelactone hydrolase
MLTLHVLALVFSLSSQSPRQVPSFEYDSSRPLDVKETGTREKDGQALRDITYATIDGGRNAATLVSPRSAGPRPAVLFVHWYGPPEPTSNRTQFIPDAVALARHGVVSLLIDTPWSEPEYFNKRTRATDYARSVQHVQDLRRALDVLLAQPDIDPSRVMLVGHDFGAMYGTLATVSDPRIKALVFMAGTPSFSDWFLYGPPRLEGAARQAFIDELAPLDPITYLSKVRVPVLLQFADKDEHVPAPRAAALTAAANEPKEVHTYEAGHALNEAATRDRLSWIERLWKLNSSR